MKRQIYLVILRLHFSLSFQSFENKWLNDFPFFISAFALFYLSLLTLGIEKFEKSIRRLAKWLGNLDQRSGQCSKVNSTVHLSEVDQMSTRNSWGLSGKKNVQALALWGDEGISAVPQKLANLPLLPEWFFQKMLSL